MTWHFERGCGRSVKNENVSNAFCNIRSVIPKREKLCSVIDLCSVNIVVLTETWLSSNVRNKFLKEMSCNVYR